MPLPELEMSLRTVSYFRNQLSVKCGDRYIIGAFFKVMI